MKIVNRWGLAAGLAAALALFGNAQAQSSTSGGSTSGGASGSGSRGDTGGPTPGGADRGTTSGDTGTTPSGGSPGTSSDSGKQGAMGSPSGQQAATGQQGGKLSKGLEDKLERLHAANQAEIQMAQVGAQNAQAPDVKQFAEQMQTEHQKADQKLTKTAQSAGAASLEGKTFQKENDRAAKDRQKLQSKTGKDFDKEFMSRMVKDHEKAVKEAESAAKDAKKANQPELAAFLDQAHSGMQGHLEHAKQIEKSLGKGGPQRQGRTPSGASGTSGPTGEGMTK